MSVTFEVKSAARGQVGIALLNRPQVLNSLNLEMCKTMYETFREWSAREDLGCIFIHGNGEKGLCAGGDVKAVREAIVKSHQNASDFQYVTDFFSYEYANDYSIYKIPKPVVAWASGITMGGGLGLIRGAAFRVVTETSVLAMPEVAIGLYPDVGAAHFLNLLPPGVGLFLATTGMRITGNLALQLGLATHFIPERKRGQVLDQLLRSHWTTQLEENRTFAEEVLARFHQSQSPSAGEAEAIRALEATSKLKSFEEWEEKVLALGQIHPWIQEGLSRWKTASPLSVRLSYEYLKESEGRSLEQVFESDFDLSINSSLDSEFPEGVRSLLVDKDGSPKWKFQDAKAVPEKVIKDLQRKRPEESGLLKKLMSV